MRRKRREERLEQSSADPHVNIDPDLDFFGLLLFEVMMWDVDQKRLPMWVIYNNPKDFPGRYVARLWYSLPTSEATEITLEAPLQTIRAALSSHGYVKTSRFIEDDPCIEEVWL